jgi:glycosyltransferase involved in cell wall biosynthesis
MIGWLKENGYTKKEIKIDSNYYDVYLKKKIDSPETSPRIVVVSYQPNKESSELLKLCIASIKKFTDTDYELWIVDNNSPEEYIKWINSVNDINIAYIRTEPKEGASFANGVALEVAAGLINQNTRYLVCFHEDIAVCRYGWLNYMISRMDGKIKAAGFRLTRARVPQGVLHVCGYIIDFQIFKELNLSFLPELPQFDVGDKAIHLLRENGFDIFHTPNTFDNPDLINLIPETMDMHNLNVTRSFNDKNEVIYMHLGRGIPKVKGEYKNKEKSSAEEWDEYIRTNLLSMPFMQHIEEKNVDRYDFLNTSIREFYILNFIKDNLKLLSDGASVFSFREGDFLGEEDKYFEKKRLNIEYSMNLEVDNKKFDCLIYPEIIQYSNSIDNKLDILERCCGKLNSGGILLITLPSMLDEEAGATGTFLYYYNQVCDKLWNLGFREVKVFMQGSTESVALISLAEKLKTKYQGWSDRKAGPAINKIVNKKLKKIIKKDNKLKCINSINYEIVTTGFSIKAVK